VRIEFGATGGDVPAIAPAFINRRIIMTMVRWDSLRDVVAHQEQMSRMFERFYSRPQEDLNRGAWAPAVDIYSNGQHELVLKAELPDMKQEEIELTVEDNTLTLRGERKLNTEVNEDQFHRIQRSYGPFARTFALPPTSTVARSSPIQGGMLTSGLGGSQAESRFKSPRNVTSAHEAGSTLRLLRPVPRCSQNQSQEGSMSTILSRPFSRTTIVPVSCLMFGLFILSGSPTTFARGMVLFLIGGVLLTMTLLLWRELAPTRVPMPASAAPPAPSSADVPPNSWPNSGFRSSSKRDTRRS
jgi:HSP20 family protein